MQKWIIPCNIKYYNIIGAFEKLQRLDWKQSAKSIEVNDEIFIYVGAPIQAIKYRCKVNKVNLSNIEIDDSEFVVNGLPYEKYGNHMELELIETYDDKKYALEILKQKGLNGNIQEPRRSLGLLD